MNSHFWSWHLTFQTEDGYHSGTVSFRKSKFTARTFCVLYFLLQYVPLIFSSTALRPWYIVSVHLKHLSYRGISFPMCFSYQSMHCCFSYQSMHCCWRLSDLFTHCDHLQISGSQDFSRVPKTTENRLISIPVTIFYYAVTGQTGACLTVKRRRDAPRALRCMQCAVRGNSRRREVHW
jgi:hypothetical protein